MKNRSLTFRIFCSIFFVGALIYFFCALIFIFNLYGHFERQIFNELESETAFLEPSALSFDLKTLSSLKTKNRITLIQSDGTVIFDNKVDIANLENHSTRKEFVDALKNGTARQTRYSATMTEKTLYFAKLLSNSTILRISCNQHTVVVLVLGMSNLLFTMLIFAMIMSGITARFTSKKITNPLNKIDLENPEESQVYDELKPFIKRIAEENYEKAQREELRRQFSANVSHELKTPLTSISGFAEILKNGGADEKTTIDFANTIYSESQRMIDVVNDILKISKLDEKSISQEKEQVSLREVTKEVFGLLSINAKKKGITFDLTGDSGNISAVRSVIYEMIFNLVDNAIKYNKKDGRVEIKITTLPSTKTLSGRVSICVRDTGIGIAEKERERIFERFYRIDKSRSKMPDGTGLGLSIVKHAAKYHDASVLLQSEEGKGSAFTVIFNLPLSETDLE